MSKRTKEIAKFFTGSLKPGPITATVREVEKNNISLSFNLDFSKYINNTGSFKKVPGRTSLKDTDSENRQKLDFLPQTRLNSRNYKYKEPGRGLSPTMHAYERSASKDSMKHSAEKLTRYSGYSDLGSNLRLRSLLDKLKNVAPAAPKGYASSAVKEKAADRISEHRSSEGQVNSLNVNTNSKKQNMTMTLASKTTPKPADNMFRKRANSKSREVTGAKNQSFEHTHDPTKIGMLTRMQNKLRSTLLN